MWMRTSTPGKLAPKRQNRPDGFTLIELMVAMAVIGLIFAMAAVSLRSVFDVELKKTASSLASTLRYLSNKAVTEHQYLRMVYDLDDQSYHAESSEDPFVISPEDDAAKEGTKKTGKAKEGSVTMQAEGEEPPTEDEAPGEEKDGGEKPAFSQMESRLLTPVKLPSGVYLKDVSVSYLPGKRESGQVFTYFFPDGFATPTLINLRDEEDENHFAIELFPLSGRVKIDRDYREQLTEGKQ